MRRIAKGILQEHDTAPIFVEFFQEDPLMRITTGEAIGRQNDDCLKVTHARLVPQTVARRTVSATATDAIVQKDMCRQHGVPVRGYVRVECFHLTLDGVRFLLLARRDTGIEGYLHGLSPPALRMSG